MAMTNPEKRDVFAVNRDCTQHNPDMIEQIQRAVDSMGLENFVVDVNAIANELTKIASAVTHNGKCAAFVGDADMAKSWETMIDEWNTDTVPKSHLSVRS